MMPVTPLRVDRALLALIVVALGWMFQIHLRLTHVDYNTFHLAGTAVLSRDWEGLYSSDRSGMGGFLYPLGAGAFFSVFAALGEQTGRLAFYLLLAACLAWTLRWCTQMWSGGRTDPRILWITLVLGSRSINDAWISGNISLLLLALAVLSYRQYVQRNSGLARHGSAAALGLAASFKVFPAVLGAFWVWHHDLRQIFRILAWTCALYLVPYLILATIEGATDPATDLFLRWIRALRDPANFGSHEMIHFQNLSAAFHRLSSSLGWTHDWVMPALAVIASVLAIVPALKRQPTTPEARARNYAGLLAWVPLLSPVTWHHLGVFYLPLLYVTVRDARNEGRLVACLPLWAFLVLYTLTGKNVLGLQLHAWVSNHSIPLFGVLALVLPATRRVFRSAI